MASQSTRAAPGVGHTLVGGLDRNLELNLEAHCTFPSPSDASQRERRYARALAQLLFEPTLAKHGLMGCFLATVNVG